MVLLDDVVEVFALAHQDVNASVRLDAFNGGRVGAALIHSSPLWHVVQVDDALQKAPSRSRISLGREKEVNCIACAINGAVKYFQ